MANKEQQQLGKILWEIADQLRGAMNADDFRDYMLSFIFLYYLSHNYETAVTKELADSYNDDLQSWYKNNGTRIPRFEDQMRKKVHYVIKPEYLWNNISELAKTNSEKLLGTLEKSFNYIETESFSANFKGLFAEINLNSDKLGKDTTQRNKILCEIVKKIAEGISKFSIASDILGDAYEYLIGEFAAGSGKKAGEFYTPQQISTTLSEFVTLDPQNPSNGRKNKLDTIMDFACGSGSLLLNIRKKLGTGKIGKIYGQEKNITTYNLARMNMLLHGVKDSEFKIHHGDTLKNDWKILNTTNPTKEIKFNAIVANPPFSYRWDPDDNLKEDFRFKNHGIAPRSSADFAFLLHGFHFLSEDGVMAIILPHGVLFRGSTEGQIRKKLLEDGNIDTVIGLPANLFFSTRIPVCILILKKCKKHKDVLFINASEYFKKKKRQNHLLDEHITKLIDTYKERKEEERYSRCVSMEEIKENEYNLNISRYISTIIPEKEIDLNENNKKLIDIEKNIAKSKNTHNKFLKELGFG